MNVVDFLKDQLKQLGKTSETTAQGVFDVVGQSLTQISAEVQTLLDQLKAWGAEHPFELNALLRQLQPILIRDNVAFVTRFDDVQEVLSRDDVFLVTYGDKMKGITGGSNFFLGMQNSPRYLRDVSNMRLVVGREDIPNVVTRFVTKTSDQIVANCGGRIEIVTQLTGPVPTRLVGSYFGTPGGDEPQLIQWATQLFQYLFVPNNPPEFEAAALASASAARNWLDQTIAARKSSSTVIDDVLGRCLIMQKTGMPGFTDLEIRNNLIGLIIGAIPTTSKVTTQAIDQLLNRPDQLAGAHAAAVANDDRLLAKYIWEALRFNPIGPGIFRLCAADYTLAKSTTRATLIPRGTIVVAGIQSAMFDEAQIDQPNEFKIDRPDYHYMHFGYGLHTCFGQYINQVQIPGIAKSLLRQKNLRRAPGPAGQLQMAGPFPSGLTLDFDV
ncbi:MAG: cytochrome P450 [Planctomycetes bacterium]|nr:cytochrome P450 [Planctomycetota bacterium]